jgi:hypothetical protein
MAPDVTDRFDVSDRLAATLDEDWYGIVIGCDAKPFRIGSRLRLIVIAAASIAALNAQRSYYGRTSPIWLRMDRLDRSIPFMPFIAVFYAFYYAVPVFLLRKFSTDMFKNPLPDHAIALALGYAFPGLICMYVGYYGIGSRALSEVAPRFTMRWRRSARGRTGQPDSRWGRNLPCQRDDG